MSISFDSLTIRKKPVLYKLKMIVAENTCMIVNKKIFFDSRHVAKNLLDKTFFCLSRWLKICCPGGVVFYLLTGIYWRLFMHEFCIVCIIYAVSINQQFQQKKLQ